jgi:hypothetical protein
MFLHGVPAYHDDVQTGTCAHQTSRWSLLVY